MSLFSLEHSAAEYAADFFLYTIACLAGATWLILSSPGGLAATLITCTIAGLIAWTLVEYVVHRYMLHGLAPFNRWHAEHHRRPAARIGSPIVLSASLLFLFAALPAWSMFGGWVAAALTLGLATGYLTYGLAHHATHHRIPFIDGHRNGVEPFRAGWRTALTKSWLRQRRRLHVMHHAVRSDPQSVHFGVTTAFWDRVFGTAEVLNGRKR